MYREDVAGMHCHPVSGACLKIIPRLLQMSLPALLSVPIFTRIAMKDGILMYSDNR